MSPRKSTTVENTGKPGVSVGTALASAVEKLAPLGPERGWRKKNIKWISSSALEHRSQTFLDPAGTHLGRPITKTLVRVGSALGVGNSVEESNYPSMI